MRWYDEWAKANRKYFQHAGLVMLLGKLREPAGEFVMLGWSEEKIAAHVELIEGVLARYPQPVYVSVPWPVADQFPELH
jgi:hypothetical protein